jgi:hypothetical protein
MRSIKPEYLAFKIAATATISFIGGFFGAKFLHRIYKDKKAEWSKISSRSSLADMQPPNGGPF